jgi:hypothetical protein
MYYDIFYPQTGETLFCVRFEILAKFFAWLYKAEYNLQGEGWL